MNVLILFSGTKSFEKIMDTYPNTFNHYSVDLDNTYKPTFNVNVLTWDYKTDLKDIKIDYIHSSPVCCEFSMLKTGNSRKRDLSLGYSLVDKTLEIYNWVKSINPNVKITIENPKSKFMRDYKPLSQFIICETSYCRYSFPYQKNTYFWSNFEIGLKCCCNKDKCDFKKKNNYHRVRIGYCDKVKYPLQIRDEEYLIELRLNGYKINNRVHLRYRIPPLLIKDIIKKVKKN